MMIIKDPITLNPFSQPNEIKNKTGLREVIPFAINFFTNSDLESLKFTSKTLKEMILDGKIFRLNYNLESFILSESTSLTDLIYRNKVFNRNEFYCINYILKETYQARPRSIADTKFGQAFPIYPEILQYAAKVAKNKNVLEIAGASGENAALLAFSGAKHVYMNDIVSAEVNKFKSLKRELPLEIQSKLTAIDGDCFKILETHPNLKNDISLIFCRNLLHFLNDQKKKLFLKNLKDILKPGGQAIFTVNSIYGGITSNQEEMAREKINHLFFKRVMCLITDYKKGTMPIASIFNEAVPSTQITPETDFNDYKSLYIYQRGEKTGGKWKANSDEYQQLDKSLQNKIKTAINQNKHTFKNIKSGSIRVLTNELQLFSFANLSNLFRNNGFEIESTFAVSASGHLVNEPGFRKGVQQIGIVIKNPS